MSGWISAGCLVGCVLLAAELIRTRSQLRASREAFDVLWKQAPVGILRADANGNCTYANETWCELSGLSQEETRGHLWSKSVHPEDLAMVMEKWQESVGKQQSYVNEVRVVRPDGSVRHVLSGACPILDTKGKRAALLVPCSTSQSDEMQSGRPARRNRCCGHSSTTPRLRYISRTRSAVT